MAELKGRGNTVDVGADCYGGGKSSSCMGCADGADCKRRVASSVRRSPDRCFAPGTLGF